MQKNKLIALLFIIVGFIGCSSEEANVSKKLEQVVFLTPKIDTSRVLASVDGVPIYKEDVEKWAQLQDKELTKSEALEEAIRFVLLANQAAKKGYGKKDSVVNEYKKVLAFQFLVKKGEGYTGKSIPRDILLKKYDSQKKRFVHDRLRKVVHVLVFVGPKHHSDKEALRLIEQIYEKVHAQKTVESFKTAAIEAANGAKHVRTEDLPFIEKGSKRFVAPFVKGVFDVDFPKENVSKIVKTQFGYHIIFVEVEKEAQNQSFKEAMPVLQKELLPKMRKEYVEQLIDNIYTDGSVFIYDSIHEEHRSE